MVYCRNTVVIFVLRITITNNGVQEAVKVRYSVLRECNNE